MKYFSLYPKSLSLYTECHEMPQKACERGFCHVTAFLKFLKCPKIEELHFRLKCPSFLSNSENGKNGAFQKIST